MPVPLPVPPRPVPALLAVALAALAGCGPTEERAAPARPGGLSYGTVLNARPVVARGDGPFAVAGAGAGRAVEFTVREDGGPELQVAQADEEGLRPGERVAIARGDRTRLRRAAGAAPARPRDAPAAAEGAAAGDLPP